MPIKRLHSSRLLVGLVLALAGFVFSVASAAAQSSTSGPPALLEARPPYQIKVGLLYKFAVNTEWPKERLPDGNTPFVFGILGTDPFGENLGFLKPKAVRKHPVVVKHFKKIEEVQDCHVLFISSSMKAQLPQILKALDNTGTLTISEVEGFLGHNGMVNFVNVKRSANVEAIGFEINRAAVEKAKLRIASLVYELRENK